MHAARSHAGNVEGLSSEYFRLGIKWIPACVVALSYYTIFLILIIIYNCTGFKKSLVEVGRMVCQKEEEGIF